MRHSDAVAGPMIGMAGTAPWPRLREDIKLSDGPVSPTGSPTWTLFDPSANRFFRIGWLDFEIISRWVMGDGVRIADDISSRTSLSVSEDHVKRFQQFASTSNLFQVTDPQGTDTLHQQHQSRVPRSLFMAFQKLMFIRIPLFRPDAFLNQTLPFVSWVFTRQFMIAVSILACIGGGLIAREWGHFYGGFYYLFNLEGAVIIFMILAFVKIIHELAHGYAAAWAGCHVRAMGIGMMMFWPILWADTSDAWKITDRKKRMLIDSAGVMAELAIAAVASVCWALMPDGPTRSIMQFLAGTTWIMTLGVNLNPFMRFDGYFLLSDLLDVANLQSRAFALGKWWMRGVLLGVSLPVPEHFPRKLQNIMILYAFGTWIYRVFLFLGIALIFYHFMFKAVGVLLMVSEVVIFLALPVVTELRFWWALRPAITRKWRASLPVIGLAILMALLFIPWRTAVTAPAMITAGTESVLYAPQGALVAQFDIRENQVVKAGDILVRLVSPDLNHQYEQAKREAAALRAEIETLSFSMKQMQALPVKLGELASSEAETKGLEDLLNQLIIRAPISGTIKDINPGLVDGGWIQKGEAMATLVLSASTKMIAYVEESDLYRVQQGATARFYDLAGSIRNTGFTVDFVSTSHTGHIRTPEIASVYGGPLAVRLSGQSDLVPVQPVYRTELVSAAPVTLTSPVVGEVHISAPAQSIAFRFWQTAWGVLVRESGF